VVICVPHTDAWRRKVLRCPVCKVRRLCLGEFQDYYGERWTCLKCGSEWQDGEYRKAGKRAAVANVQAAKQRIQKYQKAGVAPGFARYYEKLAREKEVKFG
jgi:hypothetical protein